MDTAADEKEASEILRSLLSVSRVQNPQVTEVNYWQQNDGTFQTQEQIVWQIDSSEIGKRQMSNDNRNIIHHIPVTYLTTDNRSLSFGSTKSTDKPLTYVLSHNVIAENPKYLKADENNSNIILDEPQKIVLIQELDPKLTDAGNVYPELGNTVNVMETRVFKVDGCNNRTNTFPVMEPQVLIKTEPDYSVVDIEENNNDDEVEAIAEITECGTSEHGLDPSIQENAIKRKNNVEFKKIVLKKPKKGEAGESKDKAKINVESEIEENKSPSKKKVEKRNIARKKKLTRRNNLKQKGKIKKLGKTVVKKAVKNAGPEELTDDNEEKGEDGIKFKGCHNELTKLEDNAEQVEERFKIGCECSDYNCFDGLNAEKVFKHRLNIADLTKAEHDMYLMGVIMASMQNPDETCRHKERIRIRSSYAYQGKKICLTAFLYLEHVTLYQMKRLRKHLKYHGVSPRIHGNHGRKPANTLSLDIYQHATNFVQSYIEKHSVKSVPNFTTFSSNKIGTTFISGTNLNLHDSSPTKSGKKPKKVKITNKMTSYHLPPECTKKTVHDEYKMYCEGLKPNQKVMQYSTFTSFLKKQFPNVKFQKTEKFSQTDPKLSGNVQSEDSEARSKTKKQKKIIELFDGKNVINQQATVSSKSIQTPQVFMPAKSIQIPPPPLIMAPKQNPQTLYNKTQVASGPVLKTSQIVLNGQHLQICSAGNQLVGNQIISAHCVGQTPTYTQHVYTMHNINEN